MEEKLLYKTKIPGETYFYPFLLIPVALIFLYYGIPLSTASFYLVLAGGGVYFFYLMMNPITCVVEVYSSRFIVSLPFRLKKKQVFFYEDMRSKPVPNLYMVKIPILKRYVVVYSFLYGRNAKTLSLQLSPDIKSFATAHSMIFENLGPYLKSLKDALTKGGYETGAHIVNLLELRGMTKNQIRRLYKWNDLDEEIVEKHFTDLERIKEKEFNEYKKDYSAGGYFMVAVGIVIVLLSFIMQNGRFIIWAVFAFIIGIGAILRSEKIKR